MDKLNKYVGYVEVAAALGVSRRTLERRVRAGTLPPPDQLSPNRVGWPLTIIAAHLPLHSHSLAESAVDDIDKLPPERVERQAFIGIAARLNNETGLAFDAELIQKATERALHPLDIAERQNLRAAADAISYIEQREGCKGMSVAHAATEAILNFPQLEAALKPLTEPQYHTEGVKRQKEHDTHAAEIVEVFSTGAMTNLRERVRNSGGIEKAGLRVMATEK